MKKIVVASFAVALLAGPSIIIMAADPPKVPAPEKEHKWLQQFVGEWEAEGDAVPEPGKPPVKSKGTESVHTIGGFWIVAENKGTFMNTPLTAMLTLGYDPQKKKYLGTWIDSMTSYMWKYEGTVDAAGKILTLETEGPNPSAPGKMYKFKDVIEFKRKDHKVLTSSMQGEDGKWVSFATMN